MDMRQLYDDFKKHVESLSDDAIRQSITAAIEHSSSSSSLECETERENGKCMKSSTQSLRFSNAARGFTFSSVHATAKTVSYAASNMGSVAA